jgi:hypothetical protein
VGPGVALSRSCTVGFPPLKPVCHRLCLPSSGCVPATFRAWAPALSVVAPAFWASWMIGNTFAGTLSAPAATASTGLLWAACSSGHQGHGLRVGSRLSSMSLMAVAAYGVPDLVVWPAAASAAEISRRERLPPFGLALAKCRTISIVSGFSSAIDFRPSTFRPARRLRSRAPLSFATSMAFSNSETAPSTCRIKRAVGVTDLKLLPLRFL